LAKERGNKTKTRKVVRPRNARPSSDFILSPEEIAMLKDPNWITEDDADVIISSRRDGEPTIPLDEVLKSLGLERVSGKIGKIQRRRK
jgi:hypothetical protein